ncbi:MAG: hypothetical protein ACYDC9_11890 [Dermatophilaceae bacterium]
MSRAGDVTGSVGTAELDHRLGQTTATTAGAPSERSSGRGRGRGRLSGAAGWVVLVVAAIGVLFPVYYALVGCASSTGP